MTVLKNINYIKHTWFDCLCVFMSYLFKNIIFQSIFSFTTFFKKQNFAKISGLSNCFSQEKEQCLMLNCILYFLTVELIKNIVFHVIFSCNRANYFTKNEFFLQHRTKKGNHEENVNKIGRDSWSLAILYL